MMLWCRFDYRFARFRAAVEFLSLASLLVLSFGCQRMKEKGMVDNPPEAPLAEASIPVIQVAQPPVEPPLASEGPTMPVEMPRPLRRCFESTAVWERSAVPDLLDRSESLLQADDAEGALACAEEAARQAPNSIDAHHDRASALLRLRRLDASQRAIALALALSPSDVTALVFAADLYINHLPASAEHASIGLQYVRRAFRVGVHDRATSVRMAVLEGQGLIDLGRATAALVPLGRAVNQANNIETKVAAAYEIGVAQFELCRFADAQKRFNWVLEKNPNHAQGHFHLGLILERAGERQLADAQFKAAIAADAAAFFPTVEMGKDAFEERVRQAVSQLPSSLQESLRDIPVETFDLPELEDLTAESPPLSPTILGLYRGLPLGHGDDMASKSRRKHGRSVAGRGGEQGTSTPPAPSRFVVPERAIFIYRLNLLRSVRTESEVNGAILRTLLHEVGHLLGEDDGSLRDRGLE